jgi:addiction module HigA family antidote
MTKKRNIKPGEIIGTGEDLVNQNSQDFKALQKAIRARSEELEESEKIAHQLLSLRFQMESYLEEASPKRMKQAGEFLEAFITALHIKKKDFARYIGYKESNLSAIFSGKRKINTDLAIKFGEIFRLDPVLWLSIQNKNELLELFNSDKAKYEKYQLKDLLEKVDG